MKKNKAQQAVRKNIQNKFFEWCEQTKRQPNPDSLVAYDKLFPGYKLLNHDKAKADGYYLHLRMQASALIASWATVETLKVTGNRLPSDEHVRETETRVRIQKTYDIPGKGATRVDRMDAGDLKWLISSFRIEAENKMKRAALIAERLKSLPETRKAFREAFQEAEELVFGNR